MQGSSPPRVLHVIRNLDVGGVEIGLIGVVAGLDKSGIRQVVCCLRGAGALSASVPGSVPVWVCAEHKGTPARAYLLRAARCISAFKPDVVHARNCGAWVDAALAWLLAGCPGRLIFSIHGLDWGGTIPRRRAVVYRMMARWTSALIAVSSKTAEQFSQQSGIPLHRFSVLHSGVDIGRLQPRSSADPATASKGRVVVGCVARLGPLKGHDLLIRAFAHAARLSASPLELRLFGDGPCRNELEQLVRSQSVSDSVRFFGVARDIPHHLQQLDIFVLASRSEGRPTSIMEAMATGLPVVATRVGAVPELVIDGETGLLVDEGDQAALARSIVALANDPALRRRLGACGRRVAVERLSSENMIRGYRALYERVARR